MNKEDLRAINEAYNTKVQAKQRYLHVTPGDLDMNSRLYKGDEDWVGKNALLGVSYIDNHVIVFDPEGVDFEPVHGVGQEYPEITADVIDFDSIDALEQSGLQAGWLVMHDGELRLKMDGQQVFDHWMKKHSVPDIRVVVDPYADDSEGLS